MQMMIEVFFSDAVYTPLFMKSYGAVIYGTGRKDTSRQKSCTDYLSHLAFLTSNAALFKIK